MVDTYTLKIIEEMINRDVDGMKPYRDYYGICLDHHQADSDSRACAEILLRYLRSGANVKRFIRSYNLEW
jgi:hypothetical protein